MTPTTHMRKPGPPSRKKYYQRFRTGESARCVSSTGEAMAVGRLLIPTSGGASGYLKADVLAPTSFEKGVY